MHRKFTWEFYQQQNRFSTFVKKWIIPGPPIFSVFLFTFKLSASNNRNIKIQPKPNYGSSSSDIMIMPMDPGQEAIGTY